MVLKSNQAAGVGVRKPCDVWLKPPDSGIAISASKRSPAIAADLMSALPRSFHHCGCKSADLDFLNALDAADAMKRGALAAHAAKLKTTIKALADRDYPSQFPNALDYVVLFMPANHCSAPPSREITIDHLAAGKRIMLATPASLIACSLRQHQLAAAMRNPRMPKKSPKRRRTLRAWQSSPSISKKSATAG